MKNQTKLVECGSYISIYDFNSNKKLLNFEKNSKGKLTSLKRLVLKNFVNNMPNSIFTLNLSLIEYKEVESKLDDFIAKLKASRGSPAVKFIAVVELPKVADKSLVRLHLLTSIDIYSLTPVVNEDLSLEKAEEHFSEIWGNEVFLDSEYGLETLESFISVYQRSLSSVLHIQGSKIIFKRNLSVPKEYWNEEAEVFIKENNVFDFPNHRADEIYDDSVGWVNANEYFMHGTSLTPEWK